MSKNVSVFFPLRKGSERVIGKNSRKFTEDGLSLFQVKIEQLIKLQSVAEIIVSTNDEAVMEQAKEFSLKDQRVKLVVRPDHLCTSTTKVQDLIDYVPTVVNCEHILWVHATSPFVGEKDYAQAIEEYFETIDTGSRDSLMSVSKIQQFIWDDVTKNIINWDRSKNPWPNTQHLTPLYEINHAFYISSKSNYFKLKDRIGANPGLFVLDGEKKIDVDWDSDFQFAQLVHKAKSLMSDAE